MQRYGRDFQPRYDAGYRGGQRFGGGYPGDYPAYFDQPRGPRAPQFEGWGYAPEPREQGRFPRGLPRGDWETGQPWGGSGDVDRVSAADIMTRNPEAVTPDTTLAEVAQRMRDLDVGIIPVVDGIESFRLQGVITDRDIAVRAAAEGKDMSKATAGDYMSKEVETVSERDHVREVFTVMKRERVRRVPVVDDEGRLAGIIAQADLAVTYAGLDVQREREVEEVIERISEPARPRWQGDRTTGAPRARVGSMRHGGYEHDFTDRLRDGWHTLRREARQMLGRGRGYDRGWW